MMLRVGLSRPLSALAGCRGGENRIRMQPVSRLTSSSSAPVTTMFEQRRSYYHWIPQDLVPEGATSSRFLSSNDPKEREKIIREYALAPLFGARVSCASVGSLLPIHEVIAAKRELEAAMNDELGLVEGTLSLGVVTALKDQLLFKPMSPEARRKDRLTGRVVATSLIEVFLPEDVAEEDEERVMVGRELCAIVAEGKFAKLGFTYAEASMVCDVEPVNFTFDSQVLGKETTPEEMMAIADRWEERREEQEIWCEADFNKPSSSTRSTTSDGASYHNTFRFVQGR